MSDLTPQASHDDIEGIDPPSTTMTLIGRQSEWNEFISAFDAGRMHHAWLLQGQQGVGKATSAFAFARFVLGGFGVVKATTEHTVTFDPANGVVRQIASGSHPGLLHLTRPPAEKSAGFKTQITVDEVRRLGHFFHSTTAGSWRVAIIDPADDMNRNAANALLKILEEPPARSIFLIVNHTAGQILPTIRSRCRLLRFPDLREASVAASLKHFLPETTDVEIAALANASKGSLRAALLMAVNGGLDVEKAMDRLYGLEKPDWAAVHSFADALTQRGRDAVWQLVLGRLLDKIGEEAGVRALKGEMAGANALASFRTSEARRWHEATAYNLDRKQMLVTFFDRLNAVREQVVSSDPAGSFH